MAENNEPVSFTTLAIVMKHINPNMKFSEAQIWASELHKCISDMHNRKYSSLLEFSDEEALCCGLRCPGTAKEKIQAVIDYGKCHPLTSRSYLSDSDCTSPQRIVNELLEAIKGKVDYRTAAESSDDCDISILSSDVVLLAAQTFMFRNKHYNASDEEALHAFHKAIQYLKGEQRTSTEFIKCDSRELTGIIQSVNQHFTEESIDIIGLKIAKDVMGNINQGKEPPKPDGYVTSWDLYLLSEVECLRDIYIARKEIFRNKSDNYIYPEWERIGQNCYRWYMFCAQDVNSRKEYYAVQLKKTTTIGGTVYEFKGDFRVSEDPAILKRFQRGKINGDLTTEFQGTFEYRWSRDGKPPAHPYFIVAQLYWPHFVRDLNYLLVQGKHQVTDKEALTVLYDEIPTLKEKEKEKEKEKKDCTTYTWFLNKPSNAVTDFPELKDYSEGQTFSEDYLCPSTEPLQTEGFSYEWSREEHETSHKDFTLIYRARPTLERVPQVIREENRIRFDYWQYIKEFVFFGGSDREGTVLAPDPAWIDQAHRNGVGIFGTVFLPTLNDGGKVNDIEELAKPENLQKLVDIAHRLNFEGWFLNVESYSQSSSKNSSLGMLKNSIKEMDLRGKEIICYFPSRDQIKSFDPESKGVRMMCDDEISKTATAFLEEKGKKLYFNFYLINRICSNQAPRNYLMFVDEPFWKNTLKQRKYLVDPVRFRHAQNCLWQFFLGENGLERRPTDQFPWYGIAKYAKQRKRLSKD